MFISWPWRHRQGWHWVPFPLRGPAEMSAPFLCLLGIWRYARRPQTLHAQRRERYLGARIIELCSHLGSYGMGGPGFFGLKCQGVAGESFWLVYRLWGAHEWLRINGRQAGAPQNWDKKGGGPRELDRLLGCKIVDYQVDADHSVLTACNSEGKSLAIQLSRSGNKTPRWPGTGARRCFGETEALEDALIFSRKARLWTG